MGLESSETSDNAQSDTPSGPSGSDFHIREVWAHNLEDEMDRIRDIADSYPYIAMVCVFLIVNVHLSPL
jgi:hypothetical protein